MTRQFTADLGRKVTLREGTADAQVWADTFTGRYHRPPDDMPVPATVLDVGANIGLTVAHYKALWPEAQVVAVEMDEACVEIGRQNAPDVEWRCHAVSAVGGWGSYDPSAASDAYAFRPGKRGGQHVSSYTLRQVILRSFPTDPIDFCKLDIEGGEWVILEQGALTGKWPELVRHLLVELHAAGAPDVEARHEGRDGPDALLTAAIGLLERAGFSARPHGDHPHAVYAWRA